MAIQLTVKQIDEAIPKLAKGLDQYLWLQGRVAQSRGFEKDIEFRRRFNSFYRVRRARTWQDAYYALMDRAQNDCLQFRSILDFLFQETNRFEASFASKLFATLNPSAPVIDSVVLKNLGLRLPYFSASDRATQIDNLYETLGNLFAEFLETKNGIYLVTEFGGAYPNAALTDEKKLDLVLWKTRT